MAPLPGLRAVPASPWEAGDAFERGQPDPSAPSCQGTAASWRANGIYKSPAAPEAAPAAALPAEPVAWTPNRAFQAAAVLSSSAHEIPDIPEEGNWLGNGSYEPGRGQGPGPVPSWASEPGTAPGPGTVPSWGFGPSNALIAGAARAALLQPFQQQLGANQSTGPAVPPSGGDQRQDRSSQSASQPSAMHTAGDSWAPLLQKVLATACRPIRLLSLNWLHGIANSELSRSRRGVEREQKSKPCTAKQRQNKLFPDQKTMKKTKPDNPPGSPSLVLRQYPYCLPT